MMWETVKKILASRATWIAATILLILVLAGTVLWRCSPSPGVSVPGPTQYVPVPQKIVKVKTVTVPGPERVVLVPSVIVSEKMRWPEIRNDNILAVGEVAPYRGKTSIAAVADIRDNTMTTRLISRQEPMPFFALKKELRLGMYYGNGGVIHGEVAVRPLRIGPAEVVGKISGAWGDGTNDVRAFVGAEIQFGF